MKRAVMLWIGFLVAAPAVSQTDRIPIVPEVKTQNGVSYLSGGVSEEARQQLLPAARDFNLKLVFAGDDGRYFANVDVSITDSGGRQVLNALSDGPLFFAQLPSGTYQVTATLDGRSVSRAVRVSQGSQQTVDFRLNERGDRG